MVNNQDTNDDAKILRIINNKKLLCKKNILITIFQKRLVVLRPIKSLQEGLK